MNFLRMGDEIVNLDCVRCIEDKGDEYLVHYEGHLNAPRIASAKKGTDLATSLIAKIGVVA